MRDYDPFDWHWIVADDGSRFWSSVAGAWVETLPDAWFRSVAEAEAEIEPGKSLEEDVSICTAIPSEAELNDVLEPCGLLGPTARRTVRKSVVQQRLIDAGLMDAAKEALDSNSAYFARWFAPDRPEVYADDPDALALLAAIGADAETVMAPE